MFYPVLLEMLVKLVSILIVVFQFEPTTTSNQHQYQYQHQQLQQTSDSTFIGKFCLSIASSTELCIRTLNCINSTGC